MNQPQSIWSPFLLNSPIRPCTVLYCTVLYCTVLYCFQGKNTSNCLGSREDVRNNSTIHGKRSKKGFVKDFTNNNLAQANGVAETEQVLHRCTTQL